MENTRINEINKELEEIKNNMNEITIEFLENYGDQLANKVDPARWTEEFIEEFADSSTDIYMCDLLKWLNEDSEALKYVDEAIADGNHEDLDGALRYAQYNQKYNLLTEDEGEIITYTELLGELQDIEKYNK